MGEMADFTLEHVEDYENLRFAYRTGDLSDEEAYEAGIIDELGYEYSPSLPSSKTCYCCKQTGLHWQQSKGKWRLFDANGIHQCPVKPLKE